MTKPDSPGLRRVRAVLAALGATPMTAQRIAELAHVSVWTFRNHYKRILLDDNTMHVADWEHYGFGFTHRYASGPGKTPPRPVAPPPKVATAKWKERTGYVDPRYAHRRLARPRDKVLAALMGIRA
jgi:hypothetical protein